MDPKNAIEIKNITKTFKIEVEDKNRKSTIINRNPTVMKEVKVIDDISVNIRKGDILGVLGRNGAGKSTFLSLIAKIMEPDSGTIERSGKIATILELGMGFHPDMSGRENIYLKGELYGFTRKQIDERIENIIDYSGIRDFIDNPVRTYSSGMSGRLAFAIMVNVDSDIMLVDEILSVGDAAFSAKASEHFKKMATSGKTVIFVSHNIGFIESMCNRVIWIENGKMHRDGPAKIICAEYQNKMNESPEVIFDLAQAGVAESQYRLAMMFKDGINFNKDLDAYKMWLQKASMQGHTRAQVEYGDLLIGEGNRSEAMMNYLSAAKKGDSEARMRFSSLNVPRSKSIESLLTVFQKHAETEDPLMEYRYAELLLKIAFSEDERKSAFEYYKRSADHGYPNSMHKVATMFRDGIGTKRNIPMMENYLTKAAESGFIPSMKMLYDIYISGKLVPKDDSSAFKWIKKAAELGDIDSMYKLAMMYREGVGTNSSLEQSDMWLDSHINASLMWYYLWALDMNCSDGQDIDGEYLEPLFKSNNPMAINRCIMISVARGKPIDQYVDALSHLAFNNNNDALRRLGNIYYDGVGVNRDFERAFKLYEKTTCLGDQWSMNRIGDMYRDGKGVDVDIERAISMYKKSSSFGNISAIGNIIDLCVGGLCSNSLLLESSITVLECYALSGNVDATNRLGNLYYDGRGVRRDYQKALLWYKKSLLQGNQWVRNRIFDMYSSGKVLTMINDTDIDIRLNIFSALDD